MADDTAMLAPAPDLHDALPPCGDDPIARAFPPDPAVPSAPLSSAKTKPTERYAKGGLPPMTYALAALVVAVLLWGAWVTKRVSSPVAPLPIASVRLEAIVVEYVQAQTHSGASDDQVTRQTADFMAALDQALRARGAAGTTVLVGEAVLSQNVPDITEDIRKAVYAKVPLPVPAPLPLAASPFELSPAAPLPDPGLAPAN